MLTLGWRLKMALGGMKRSEMAEKLGYEDSTLSRWMSDKGRPPRHAVLVAWALATNVSLEWLEKGTGPVQPPPGEESPPESDELAALTERKKSRAATRGSDTHRYVAAA